MANIKYRLSSTRNLEDLALLTDIASAARDKKPLPTQASKYALEGIKERMARQEADTLAAVEGSRIVGYVLTHPLLPYGNNEADADALHLSMMMAHPEYWGTGLAVDLAEAATKRARTLGLRRITLWTNKIDNDRALAFYKKMGFAPNGQQKTNEHGQQIMLQKIL